MVVDGRKSRVIEVGNDMGRAARAHDRRRDKMTDEKRSGDRKDRKAGFQ